MKFNYSAYKLEREGRRSQDNFTLSYEPKNSPVGVSEQIAPWLAHFIRAALLEHCPENVREYEYGYRQEQNTRRQPSPYEHSIALEDK